MDLQMSGTSKIWDIDSFHADDEWNLGIKDLDAKLKLVVQIKLPDNSVWAECKYVAAGGGVDEHLAGTHSSGKNFRIFRNTTGQLKCEVMEDQGNGPVTGWTAQEGAG